ncbi:MAG: bile acid:sodium symporter family protein, partial [Bacteroidales bacterium]|nr:bile acid:sodium symporter family protein [Bacteroidales bacterium]
MKKICQIIAKYLTVLVLLAAVLGLLFPGAIRYLKPVYINPLLGVIMFCMGMTLKTDYFRVVFRRP